MKHNLLEVCVDSVESAIAAVQGGADRLELCSNLNIGGTTPGVAIFQEIRKLTDIKIHVLIRPRAGDFCYTPYEFNLLRREVKLFRELGADGVVFGILQPDGNLNVEQMRILMKEAEGMSVTLHRAFDVCCDPFAALEQAIALGIDTILTSGQAASAVEGIDLLTELNKKAVGRIKLMTGGGIHAEVISRIAGRTGIEAFHMSGKVLVDGAMKYRKNINMGSSEIDEYSIWRTQKEKIEEAKKRLGEAECMRLLFEIDKKDYDDCVKTFIRPSVRGIIVRDGRIAMMHSLKYDYYKFPGGGIDEGETHLETLIREVKEESGLTVVPESVQPFGMVHRVQKSDANEKFIQDNYYYLCRTEDSIGTQTLDEYEAQEQFTLEFVTADEAIKTNESSDRGSMHQTMTERENRILRLLKEEVLSVS